MGMALQHARRLTRGFHAMHLPPGVAALRPPREPHALAQQAYSPRAAEPIIYVCQAGSCRAAGSEAVLLEMNELVLNTGCAAQPTGCLGACRQAPNALFSQPDAREVLHTRLDSVEKSAAVAGKATGRVPQLADPARQQRLAPARRLRARQQAWREKKWNAALSGMADEVAASSCEEERIILQFERAQLYHSAGQWELALEQLRAVQAASNHPQVLMGLGIVLGKLGRLEELDALQADTAQCFVNPESARTRTHIANFLQRCRADAARAGPDQPPRIEGYAEWTLSAVSPVSAHSALFRFASSDRSRSTPNPRTALHKTWHTTMLAEVGPNEEGPLPWVERDYAPVSTWMDWERGECDLIVTVHPAGTATAWLHRQEPGRRVWLSRPKKTMHIPTLVTEIRASDSVAALRHKGVLLVVGGTGLVTGAAQVLQHADQETCFGVSTQSAPPLTSPVSLIYACRRDDVLMTGDLARWCTAEAGRARLQRCVLALSSQAPHAWQPAPTTPFTTHARATGEVELAALPNVSLVESLVTRELLESELALLRAHVQGGMCRVVVAGPAAFNRAVREMLVESGEDMATVTILDS